MAEKTTFSDYNSHIIRHWAHKTLPLHTAAIKRDPRGPFHRRSSDMIYVDVTAGKLPNSITNSETILDEVLIRSFCGSTHHAAASPWDAVLCSPAPWPSSLNSYLSAFYAVSRDTTYDQQDMSKGMWKWWLYGFWGIRKNCERWWNAVGFLVGLPTCVN